MRIISFNNHAQIRDSVVTIGVFDGVHIGHKFVLEMLKNEAKNSSLTPIVLTFDVHPQLFFGRDKDFKLLNTEEEKIGLLSKTGIEYLVISSFKDISKLSYQSFINDILIKKLNVKCLLLGYNQKIGKNAEGTREKIVEYSQSLGLRVKLLEKLSESVHISSSEIRKAILQGDIRTAKQMLGYNYSFEAKVVEGKKLGRNIGFPTANLLPVHSGKIMPATGVYAVKVYSNDKTYTGMMNYGYRPTVERSASPLAEVHIFDFNQTIYSETIRIELVERIRGEHSFPSLDELVQQMKRDKEQCLRIFSNN